MLAIGMPGLPEMFVILVIVLVLFGAKKIPELARSLGKATKEFKEAKSAFNDAVHEPPEQIESSQNVAPPADDEDFDVDDKKEEAKAESSEKSDKKDEAKAESKEK